MCAGALVALTAEATRGVPQEAPMTVPLSAVCPTLPDAKLAKWLHGISLGWLQTVWLVVQ